MVVACVVCARPLDSLLTSGLHAGVAVLALLAATAVAGIAWGAWRVIQDDAIADAAPAARHEVAP